jgi:hypothetical protein
LVKLNLVRAYKKQKFDLILQYNEALFGKIDAQLLKLSKEKIFLEDYDKEMLGRVLSPAEVRKIVRSYLNER